MYFLMLALFVLSAASANAQVTIGTTNDPHAGAVLDLQSTTKGLLLPNVSLEKVSKFQLATDAEAASGVGMIVFNINANIVGGNGAGIYVWDGTKWMSALGGNTKPEPEPNPDGTVDEQIGNNIYKTYDYDGTVWMVENSKEGTSTAQMYNNNASQVNGYYYTYAQAAGACPSGWHLPTQAEWTALMTWVNANKTDPAAAFWITSAGSAFAGGSGGGSTWYGWATVGYWWSAGASSQHYFAGMGGMLGPGATTGDWFSVRCVKN